MTRLIFAAGHYQAVPGEPAFMPEHGCLYRNGGYITIDCPGARTRLFEITDTGVIIGWAIDADGRSFAFSATPEEKSAP